MPSAEYKQQRARSDHRNASREIIDQQQEIKHRCHVLRSQRRNALKHSKELDNRKWIPPAAYDLARRLRNGELDAELDDLTVQHGYGQLRATDEYMSAPCLFDYVP